MNEHVTTMLQLSSTASQRKLTGEELDTLNGIITATNGLEEALGVRYTEVAPHSLTLRLEVKAMHLQPWGITNGGIYATLGETAASMASFVAAGAGPIVVGTNNSTDFLRPSKAGDVIVST
ncbi:MAG TPA: PaaI family thioesterase, partial [Corynebacterium urealyticum]|nr:PaaI family thioesterase [Corynebacterium urealyticum]